jgi:hypothetical protein
MSIQIENFRPVGDVLPVVRRDIGLADKNLANPRHVNSLVDGEWMVQNQANRLERAVDIAAAGNQPATTTTGYVKKSYPLWGEQGRYDIQAMFERKSPVLWGNFWEFETLIFDAAAVVGAGAAITDVDQPLKVASIDIDGKIVSGLVGWGVGDTTSQVVAIVTRLHTNNGGWLRIRGGFAW